MINRIRDEYKNLNSDELLALKKYFVDANKSLETYGNEKAYKDAINCNSSIIDAIDEVLNSKNN